MLGVNDGIQTWGWLTMHPPVHGIAEVHPKQAYACTIAMATCCCSDDLQSKVCLVVSLLTSTCSLQTAYIRPYLRLFLAFTGNEHQAPAFWGPVWSQTAGCHAAEDMRPAACGRTPDHYQPATTTHTSHIRDPPTPQPSQHQQQIPPATAAGAITHHTHTNTPPT